MCLPAIFKERAAVPHHLIHWPANQLVREVPTFPNRPQFCGMLGPESGCLANNTLLGLRAFKNLKHNFRVPAHHSGVLTYQTNGEMFKKTAASPHYLIQVQAVTLTEPAAGPDKSLFHLDGSKSGSGFRRSICRGYPEP